MPFWLEELFAKANGLLKADGTVNSQALRDLLSSRLNLLAEKLTGSELRLSIHGTPENAIWKFNVNAAAIAGEGSKVRDLEFQIYETSTSGFRTSVESLVAYFEKNPHFAKRINALKIGMSSFANDKVFSEAEINQRAAIVKAALEKLQKSYPDLQVSLSLFPFQGFFRKPAQIAQQQANARSVAASRHSNFLASASPPLFLA
jgi:hypothetical protein